MKIYTRRGDSGKTDLLPHGRVWKDDPRMEALGDLDELNSWLGVIRAHNSSAELEERLEKWQQKLLQLGSEMATLVPFFSLPNRLTPQDVKELEGWIDYFNEKLPPLDALLTPSGTPGSTFCHLARTVCRRLERKVVAWEGFSPELLAWVNRFSDLLFVLARFMNTFEKPEEKP